MKKKETKEGRGGHGPSRSSETISKGTCRTSSAQHYKRYISGSQFYKLISARRFRLLNARVQRRGSRLDSEWRKEYRLHKKGLPYYPSSPSLLVIIRPHPREEAVAPLRPTSLLAGKSTTRIMAPKNFLHRSLCCGAPCLNTIKYVCGERRSGERTSQSIFAKTIDIRRCHGLSLSGISRGCIRYPPTTSDCCTCRLCCCR